MTEKITLELTLEELKQIDKYIEYHDYDCDRPLLDKVRSAYPQPRMKFVCSGKCEVVSYNGEDYFRYEFNDGSHNWYKRKHTVDGMMMVRITDGERLLEGLWFNNVKKGKYDEVECDEKDNPKPMDEVVDRIVKKYQAQKLYNRLYDELGYDFDACNNVVDLVEDWLPKEQDASGSQNVDTELLVDGFNDCVRKMKEMLR